MNAVFSPDNSSGCSLHSTGPGTKESRANYIITRSDSIVLGRSIRLGGGFSRSGGIRGHIIGCIVYCGGEGGGRIVTYQPGYVLYLVFFTVSSE